MCSFSLTEDKIRVAWHIYGEGAPIVLLHGFASSAEQNWKSTGWIRTLTEAGRKVIAPDFRGHGESEKPHDPACYGAALMNDVLAVLAAEQITQADFIGYSMGGSVTLLMLRDHPQMVRRAILAGVGSFYLSKPLPMDSIARALESGKDDGPLAAQFRLFASQAGKDKQALAACIRALPPRLNPAELGAIRHKVLVACGDRDGIAGRAPELAACIPGAEALELADKDHMSAVGDLHFKRMGTEFLSQA